MTNPNRNDELSFYILRDLIKIFPRIFLIYVHEGNGLYISFLAVSLFYLGIMVMLASRVGMSSLFSEIVCYGLKY